MRMLRSSALVVAFLGITTGTGWAQAGPAPALDPRTGLPMSTPLTLDPRTHLPQWSGPSTGLPTDPRTGARFDPQTRRPIDRDADVVLDPQTGRVVDRQTGEVYRPSLEAPSLGPPSTPGSRVPPRRRR